MASATFFAAICFLMASVNMVHSEDSCNLNFEKTLFGIFSPREQPTTEVRNFRRYLLRILQKLMIKAEEEEGWNAFAYTKRNLEALARAGYLHTLPQEENQTEVNERGKRSLASLAKNGQLPIQWYNNEDSSKRSVEPNDSIYEQQKEIQKLLDELYASRGIFSKRAGNEGYVEKRNAAALLKNDRYLNNIQKPIIQEIQSIMSSKGNYKPSNKGQLFLNEDNNFEDGHSTYEDDSDYYSNKVNELLDGAHTQKRFLGSIAKGGWYNSQFARPAYNTRPDKRHIGSLARLGWLPTIRNIRRFSRSGRSFSIDDTGCRTPTSNGQAEDYFFTKNTIPLDTKRFHPVPAMWKVPLQTFNY